MFKILSYFVLLSLSACAVLDISTLDTALPLAPSKVQIVPYQALGLDLKSVIQDEDSDDDSARAAVDGLSGLKLNISVQPELDLQMRAYAGSQSWGAKLGVKKLVRHEGRHYLAVAPALNWVQELEQNNNSKIRAMGVEMQVIYSQALGKSAATVVLRGNYNKYREEIEREDNGHYWQESREYDIASGGARVNVQFKYKQIFLIPEFGVEVIPVVNGRLSLLPTLAYAIGVEF